MASIVQQAVEAARKLVSKPEGMFDYKKGQTWVRFNYWLNHMAQIPGNDMDMVLALAKKYCGSVLTPQDCSSIIGIVGLQEIVTSYNDVGILGQVEISYLAGRLTEASPIIIGLMAGAKEGIERDVVYTYKHQAEDEYDAAGNERTKEDKVAGLLAFGMNQDEAYRCQWSGNTVMNQSGNYIDFWGLAGVQV